MFPITINDNVFDRLVQPADESLKTKYILIQGWTRLNPSNRQELRNAGVKHCNYVSKNTYLCRYGEKSLNQIRQLDFVIYVNIYPHELKIVSELKGAERDQTYEVEVVFHEGVDPSSLELQSVLEEKSHCAADTISYSTDSARLTIQGCYLDDVASIDDVFCIEPVEEDVAHDDAA